MDEPIEPLLTVDETAKALSLSRSFTYQLIADKAFPVVRVGRTMRIRPQDLRNYVKRLVEEQNALGR